MIKTSRVTAEGLHEMQEELERRISVDRKAIKEDLVEARSHGDLSENAEYDEARNAQAINEARIHELEEALKGVEVIDDAGVDANVVSMGRGVKVLDLEYDEEEVLHIVGTNEIDLANNKISDDSPVGRALLGHKVGEEVIVNAPGGDIRYKILQIISD